MIALDIPLTSIFLILKIGMHNKLQSIFEEETEAHKVWWLIQSSSSSSILRALEHHNPCVHSDVFSLEHALVCLLIDLADKPQTLDEREKTKGK